MHVRQGPTLRRAKESVYKVYKGGLGLGPRQGHVCNWRGLAGVRASLRAEVVRCILHTLSQGKGQHSGLCGERDGWNRGYCQSGRASGRGEGLGLGFTNRG